MTPFLGSFLTPKMPILGPPRGTPKNPQNRHFGGVPPHFGAFWPKIAILGPHFLVFCVGKWVPNPPGAPKTPKNAKSRFLRGFCVGKSRKTRFPGVPPWKSPKLPIFGIFGPFLIKIPTPLHGGGGHLNIG